MAGRRLWGQSCGWIWLPSLGYIVWSIDTITQYIQEGFAQSCMEQYTQTKNIFYRSSTDLKVTLLVGIWDHKKSWYSSLTRKFDSNCALGDVSARDAKCCNNRATASTIGFVSPELSSVRDYVITHSVRSMYVVCSMCMWYFAKLITVSMYIDVLSWDLDQWSLGRVTHVTSTDMGSKVI